MNKYVKIEGYPDQYFMMISKKEELPNSINKTMSERIERTVAQELTSDKKPYQGKMFFERYNFVCNNTVNYARVLKEYDCVLLIRKIGSFMTLNDNHIIEEEIYSNDFPSRNDDATIVICENDMYAEKEWVDYLKKTYPNEKIKVLNFFNSRTKESVLESFDKAKKITFSTTFSKHEWFKKLVDCCNYNHKIIGYSHNPEEWNIVKDYLTRDNLEIVQAI